MTCGITSAGHPAVLADLAPRVVVSVVALVVVQAAKARAVTVQELVVRGAAGVALPVVQRVRMTTRLQAVPTIVNPATRKTTPAQSPRGKKSSRLPTVVAATRSVRPRPVLVAAGAVPACRKSGPIPTTPSPA